MIDFSCSFDWTAQGGVNGSSPCCSASHWRTIAYGDEYGLEDRHAVAYLVCDESVAARECSGADITFVLLEILGFSVDHGRMRVSRLASRRAWPTDEIDQAGWRGNQHVIVGDRVLMVVCGR